MPYPWESAAAVDGVRAWAIRNDAKDVLLIVVSISSPMWSTALNSMPKWCDEAMTQFQDVLQQGAVSCHFTKSDADFKSIGLMPPVDM